MNGKIVSLFIVILMIVGSISAVGTTSEAEAEDSCDCDVSTERQYYTGILPGDPLPPGKTFTGFTPSSWNWRNAEYNGVTGDWTTSIKDQGNCGSCYAFAAYAAMESCIKIKSENPDLSIDLSEQFMVSCGLDWVSGIKGCCGGQESATFNFIEEYGGIPESCFNYKAIDADGRDADDCPDKTPSNNPVPCSDKCGNWQQQQIHILDWDSVSSSQESIKNALLQYGPLPATMSVYEDFYNYGGGVYEHKSGGYEGSHMVTIVGYNDNSGCWICKNSWGKGWGESGWFKIKYGECSIEQEVVYLEVDMYNPNELYLYGQEWDEDADGEENPPVGDWKNYGNHAIRMGEDMFGGDAKAWYMFDLGVTNVCEGMTVGIYFADWAALPGFNGPDLSVYNWDTGQWKTWSGVGSNDDFKWVWKTTTNSNAYVDNRGWVWVKIYAESNDDTVLDTIGVKYATPTPPAEPDLDCSGSLSWSNVKPGSKVTGSFTVKNIGDSNSKLDWKVDSYPSWGSYWKFTPPSGNDLEPEDGSVTVQVSVWAPDEKNKDFSGKIKVINTEDSSDYDTVPISISTPRNKPRYNAIFNSFLEKLPLKGFLFNFLFFI